MSFRKLFDSILEPCRPHKHTPGEWTEVRAGQLTIPLPVGPKGTWGNLKPLRYRGCWDCNEIIEIELIETPPC